MAELPAVNASPLIFMAAGECLDLLRAVCGEVIVPASVADEIERRGPDDPTARALREASWIHVVPDPPIPSLIQTWDLGPGESAVLAWAHARPGTEAIIDDRAARRCAASLGVPVRRTLGLVLTAKRRRIIPAARPVLNRLRSTRMYLSDQVLNAALALVDE